ncbi:acetyl-CoA C-acyltransferase [Candidatus Viridilinea mediisalina]|uniref:acetyl-CoA C-acyltransferase n=1 Tax=Candidatus Viridilinea mediisalina TaxID=2024553 RepID=A0A2A6RMD5_9CHLR|nr:acetyl-CoA C-acyltransferase [Candidatus Viridilinea mediisalina]PDW04254.1 acetyl-CoA acetyltransferase [Candidatus Viridilinea mediisalina]
MTHEAVIVSGARTAVGKAPKGSLRTVRPDELAAAVIKAALERVPGLDAHEVEDVLLGCAMPEAEQGLNLARIAAQRAGLPDSVCGMTINRFCASGLQTIASAAQQIIAGQAEVIIAGGAESMSMVPMGGHKFAPNPHLAMHDPAVYMGMGLTAEQVAREHKISREDQDAFALRSHQNALRAQAEGAFEAGIVPLSFEVTELLEGQAQRQTRSLSHDEGPRADTSLEALGRLKPAFAMKGSVTAGNSSQMSDGAAAVVVMSRAKAEALGLKPKARFISFAVGGVAPEVMGIGPVVAIPKALKLAGLSVSDIDLIELNEAFAAQALAVVRALGLDLAKVNVNGGAIALGHPLGCTGAKLTVQLLDELERRGGRYGLVSMCIGGGMGAAGIFERLG